MPNINDIRIRDPFILTDSEEGCYYMYGTTDLKRGSIDANNSFSVYKSYDLYEFEGPKVIFDGRQHPDFWGKYDFWAPEVHRWQGRYYMLGSCKAKDRCRGTHIFVCDTPDGDFRPLTDEPITPAGWECLDGTLYFEGEVPYLIFSHEWLQVGDGEICAMQLSPDLTHAVGEPVLLFTASSAPDVSELSGKAGCYVTDGPFIFKEGEKINLIWSSFLKGRYLVLRAEADGILGPYRHLGSQFDFDGGHAMVFKTLSGERMISLHSPDTHDLERATFRKF